MNNPLKYIDPSGNIVEIENEDICKQLLEDEEAGLGLSAEQLALLDEYAKLHVAYYLLSLAAPDLTRDLEAAELTVYISLGTPSNDWAAEYDMSNNTLKLDKDNKFLLSHRSILDLAHEARHAWQDVVAYESANTLFDLLKWSDTVYMEWDAYKFQADLDDQLGWKTYKKLWGNQQKFFQALNLENSWNDYQKALHRFALNSWERLLWWKIKTPTIYRGLTEDLYMNK